MRIGVVEALTPEELEHKKQWEKIEKAEGIVLCDHCKHNSQWGEYGEDGTMYFQPDYAHYKLSGVAKPYENEDVFGRRIKPYRLEIRLCQSHIDFGESPDGDYYYEIEEEVDI